MLTLYQFEISPFCDKVRRILHYKRLAGTRGVPDLDAIGEELADRYGPVPATVDTLMRLIELRPWLKDARVVRARQRGTSDVLGDDALARDRLTEIAKGVLEPAGYQRIETPTFESTQLFARGDGRSQRLAPSPPVPEGAQFPDHFRRTVIACALRLAHPRFP